MMAESAGCAKGGAMPGAIDISLARLLGEYSPSKLGG
jgi:hypothetical protein